MKDGKYLAITNGVIGRLNVGWSENLTDFTNKWVTGISWKHSFEITTRNKQ